MGSEPAALFLASLDALAVETIGGACWVPAVAACFGAEVAPFETVVPVAGTVGTRSALVMEVELTLTGFGTGYCVGIEPRFAYV